MGKVDGLERAEMALRVGLRVVGLGPDDVKRPRGRWPTAQHKRDEILERTRPVDFLQHWMLRRLGLHAGVVAKACGLKTDDQVYLAARRHDVLIGRVSTQAEKYRRLLEKVNAALAAEVDGNAPGSDWGEDDHEDLGGEGAHENQHRDTRTDEEVEREMVDGGGEGGASNDDEGEARRRHLSEAEQVFELLPPMFHGPRQGSAASHEGRSLVRRTRDKEGRTVFELDGVRHSENVVLAAMVGYAVLRMAGTLRIGAGAKTMTPQSRGGLENLLFELVREAGEKTFRVSADLAVPLHARPRGARADDPRHATTTMSVGENSPALAIAEAAKLLAEHFGAWRVEGRAK